MFCDLHLHSDCSDGELSPAGLLTTIAAAGVRVAALTDHDTVEGVDRARARAAECGVHLVSGIEMTAYTPGRVVHVLGLGIRLDNSGLRAANGVASRVWSQNQERWIKALSLSGASVSWSRDFADHPVRLPVLIERLCRRGVAGGDPHRCYQNFLLYFDGLPRRAYADLPTPEQAAAIIRAAGGLAILAHPRRLGDEGMIRQLLDQVDGLEAMYAAYSSLQRRQLRTLARRTGKLYSGGSDYHGFFQAAYENPRFQMPPSLAAYLKIV
ncbi:MAG: PHP domain-containing protein [Candidatus Eremiobacteraeota bacterium]|nr:PHP domain-containing protein [Candidatus Eremiobacteraeota bacterium]MBC5827681.1 PHP domain-containing protein [Candidatus Eremiobacteraeota bacterium]